MSDLGFSDDLAFSSDSLASNRLSPAPPGRRRTRTGTSNTRGGSDGGSVDSSSTKSGLMATSTPSRSTRERRREKPRGKGILHVDKDIADSRSSSASSSAREKSRTRHGDADQSPPNLRGLVKPENNEEQTYEEMFGAVERQQRAEEASSSLGVSGQSNFTLGMSLQSESLAISEGMLNPDGRVSRQETAQYKPPRPPAPPGGVFNESLSKETGWAGDLSSPSTAANRRRSLQQFARSSSPGGGRAQSTSGRLSVFDDLLESKRDSMFSVGSSMRGDIEKTFGDMAPSRRANGPFDLGGRFNARNRFIYYGMDHMYSSMDDVFSVTHWDAPRDLSRKKHIPSKPYSYLIPDISFTMADLAKYRWKAKPRSYRPAGPFASPEELLTKLGLTIEYSYTKVELLPKDTFTKMQWKRPLHHHFQHRFYKRGFFHDIKWQDRVLYPAPPSPTPRRHLHTLGVGSPAYGKGTVVHLPRHRELMLVEESLSYCITMQHLHRFEAACVSSFELIMKQERAGRRVIKKSMNRFVSMHIDTMLKSLAETEAINRQQIEDEILGVDSLALLQVVVSEGIMRFVLACEEEEYLAGLGRVRDVAVDEVLVIEQDRRDEFAKTTTAVSSMRGMKEEVATTGGRGSRGEMEEEEEEWMRGGKYERYLIGAARRVRKETPIPGQYHYSSTTSPRVASPSSSHLLNDGQYHERMSSPPPPSSISRAIKFAFSPSDDTRSQFWTRPSSGKEQHQSSTTPNDDDVGRRNLLTPCDSNIEAGHNNIIDHHHCNNYDTLDDGVEEGECIPSHHSTTAATSDANTEDVPTNTLRVRPTRYPRRPASSAGKSQRPAAASSSALAATLNTFINNQWALPKSNLRSPVLMNHSTPPTHQAITNEPHHQFTITVDGAGDDGKDTVQSRPSTATTHHQHNYRPVTSSPPPPPKRVPLPSSLQRRGTAPQPLSTTRTLTTATSGVSSRPLLIGRASSPISDQTFRQNTSASSALLLSPHQPAAGPTRPQAAFTFVEMRKMRAKLDRFDEDVYTGPMHQRSTPPMGM